MIFPNPEAGGVARHPSQLYEAALEGLLLFLVLRFLTHRKLAFLKPGLVSGTMILGYGLARIFVENFRQFDEGVGLMIGPFTPGMIYSVPMVLLGSWLIYRARAGNTVSLEKQAKASGAATRIKPTGKKGTIPNVTWKNFWAGFLPENLKKRS